MFPNVTADTYTVEVTAAAFKITKRTGVVVSGGDRVGVPPITIAVGGATETVTVTAEAPLVQTQSGERSFAVSDHADREPADRARQLHQPDRACTPGVENGGVGGGARLGGAGQNNIMMDGISAMDTGNNGQMLNMNIESIAEVKVLTQGYQAEYGRSSGLQITAVTKSGTNRFHGSVYDIVTNSDWNANSWVNAEERRREADSQRARRCGYTIGGPVGKPGGNNKLFFFYSHEYRPATTSPTAATRSAAACRRRSSARATSRRSLDNNGALIPRS